MYISYYIVQCMLARVRYAITVHKYLFPHTQTGHSEQFEQVLFDARPLRLMLKLRRAVKWCRAHPKLTIATITMVFSIPVVALTVFKQN